MIKSHNDTKLTSQEQDKLMHDRSPEEIADRAAIEQALISQHETDIDDIPWQDAEPTSTALVPSQPQNMVLVQGLEIDPTLPQEEKIRLLTMASSYIGVIPHAMDEYVNTVVTMLGCAIAPIEHIDNETGETSRWNACLFKVATDNASVVVNGGGKQGMMFARSAMSLFGAGDWQTPMKVHIRQENRTGKDGQPRRMYRFQFLGEAK